VNYFALLGWSPKGNREKLPLTEIIELFDLPQILRHNARFDMTKLAWLNGEYIREMSNDRFYELSIHALERAGLDTNRYPAEYVKAALDTCKGKVKLFNESGSVRRLLFHREDRLSSGSSRPASSLPKTNHD
jgi:glutamyl/glutaminyl-tRNA synthetase